MGDEEPREGRPPAWRRGRARLDAFATAHPKVWASRHVVLAVGQVAATILGIGLAVRFVLPSLPWPDWDLPDLPRPHLPDLTPGWVERAGQEVRDVVSSVVEFAQPVLGTTKYWLPILVALAVAGREIDRRRKREEEPEGDQTPPQSGRSGRPET